MVIVSRQPAQLASGISVKRLSAHRLLPIAVSVVLLLGIVVYRHIFTPEQNLRAEMYAYQQSVLADNPRPDRVRHLSSESVPILIKWLRPGEPEVTFQDQVVGLVRRVTFNQVDFTYTTVTDNHPPSLALMAFHILGTNAASAIPELRKSILYPGPRAEGSDISIAIRALAWIGEPSLDVAAEFCRHPLPGVRYIGADLVGSIGKQPGRSMALLLPLLEDPEESVRVQAYEAFAKFPGPESEAILLPRLRTDDIHHAAYALHTGSANALIHLIDACMASTDDKLHASLLAALATNEEVQPSIKLDLMTRSTYVTRSRYVKQLVEISRVMENQSIDQQLAVIRSNIINLGRPQVIKSLIQSKPAN